jgi:hypothetical protein
VVKRCIEATGPESPGHEKQQDKLSSTTAAELARTIRVVERLSRDLMNEAL